MVSVHKLHLCLALFLAAFAISELDAQPYYYYAGLADSQGNADLYRLNLLTGDTSCYLRAAGRLNGVYWTSDQSRIFLHVRFSLEIIETSTGNSSMLFDGIQEVSQILDAPLINRMFISCEMASSGGIMTVTFDRTSFQPIDTLYNFYIWDLPFLSANEGTAFRDISDSTGFFFQAISTADGNVVWERRCGSLGPFAFSAALDDGEKGLSLMRFQYLRGYENQRYAVCNPESNVVYPEIRFPVRSKGYLSPTAQYVILEQVNFDTTRPTAEYRPGNVSIYESRTGRLLHNFQLPPEGKILFFDNHPDL